MHAEREFPRVHVNEKAERALRGGHPWVYGAEVTRRDEGCRDGKLVDVVSRKGRYLGTGYYNSASKILVRVISENANDRFDEAFYERRLRHALDYRRQVMGADFKCCRLIFGEADRFPGLTVDRFGPVLVTEVLSLGTERVKMLLYRKLLELLREGGDEIECIYERSDSINRRREGLENFVGYIDLPGLKTGGEGVVDIVENGVKYRVDFVNGQKTGFFLDQKYNRAAVKRIAHGRRVLDCFTHTGAFALNAAMGGAESVMAVDVSQTAIERARENAALSGLDGIVQFKCANVFELLTELAAAGGHPYDFIILDPPAFTKSGGTVKNAARGYKEINMKAMKLLPRGGYLATCSCSHFMTDELFRDMLRSAASDAGVALRQIEGRQQSPDHPILWNVPETDYLKFYIFQVV